MTKRMLIDGSHPEEERVVITSANRLDEYDVETSTKKRIKGNIYLAKVTRVEPSLQAAFVDFGGDRHGFLAFNDIHPDYFQIPIEDRKALIEEESAEQQQEDAVQALVDEIDGAIADQDDDSGPPEEDGQEVADAWADGVSTDEESPGVETGEGVAAAPAEVETATGSDAEADALEAIPDDQAGEDAQDDAEAKPASGPARRGRRRNAVDAGSDDAEIRLSRRRARRYKIQEVIKRRQIILVQVVKEERGNKGAALTTYISLAGRYCVLMPNTARGGGISRKITNTSSRRKLKEILNELEIQDGMGVIMRTAGMERTKSEIKRDFEYLFRAWDDIRERTMQSIAPTPVYEDASLIKRAIRDLYTKDIEEVLIEGADAYQTAKKFMRLMMPSHAKRVQPYRDENIPLFHRYQVEDQLDAIHSPEVQLKSGGYIVIHSTEALVAVDVNSGKSTRERNIEETALKTNLEAADEVARQLRLRDLAGLVVIDFIDMEESRHLRQVERRLKDAMKPDRARIQIGRISGFGLLEMSRQRLRPSLQEASTQICQHCHGQGFVRSTESMALVVLRALEDEGIRQRSSDISVAVPTSVALYVLNNKRKALGDIEARYGFSISLIGDDTVVPPDMRIERTKALPTEAMAERVPAAEEAAPAEAAVVDATEPAETGKEDGEHKQTRARRSRRRRATPETAAEAAPEAAEAGAENAPAAETAELEETAAPKRRRRGRRGGRGRSARGEQTGSAVADEAETDETTPESEADPITATNGAGAEPAAMEPETADVQPAPADDAALEAAPAESPAEPEGSNGEQEREAVEESAADDDVEAPAPVAVPHEVAAGPPRRRGWWQRLVD